MTKTQQDVVIRFCGDSGDGMQLTGNLFSNLSAILGNEISTFPDFPAEIRAPQGTLGGVSGFQLHLGTGKVYTPGDFADVLVAMNPAALKTNYNKMKKEAVLIIDTDSFTPKDLEKAEYKTDNPLTELGLPESVQVIPVALTNLTKESLKDSQMDLKAIVRCKNMFALGVVCWLFNRPIDKATSFLEQKFKKKPDLLHANIKVLTDGYNYASNLHLNINTFLVTPATNLPHGRYTSISGNKATAFGLIAAAEKAGKKLFLGSYPITPATDIMQELALRKDMGVMVIQAEDEISAVCTAIGASFAGDLAVTSTSGPGLSLKSEAIGLAVMAELPIVIIDVQRGGPSTGLPTKTEQTDLAQALYGRNGECPLVVMAAGTPDNCFNAAYMAAKIALENMTPVILLSDTYLANGTSLWKLPTIEDMPDIQPQTVTTTLKNKYNAALRDEHGIRYWAVPGMEGYEHRNIGLERDSEKGTITTDPQQHRKMVETREKKISRVQTLLPPAEIHGPAEADTLLIGFGSTEGHLRAAAQELTQNGIPTAQLQINYIKPLQANIETILQQFKRIVVCELNSGQLLRYLRSIFTKITFESYCKVDAQPFMVSEIVEYIKENKYDTTRI